MFLDFEFLYVINFCNCDVLSTKSTTNDTTLGFCSKLMIQPFQWFVEKYRINRFISKNICIINTFNWLICYCICGSFVYKNKLFVMNYLVCLYSPCIFQNGSLSITTVQDLWKTVELVYTFRCQLKTWKFVFLFTVVIWKIRGSL